MQLPDFLKSRKFWALIIGALVVAARSLWPTLPISDEQLTALAFLLVAFIIGTGLEDVGNGYSNAAIYENMKASKK